MRCTDHDRDHCPEPRCHVLALCAAEIPDRHSQSPRIYTPDASAWIVAHGYDGGGFAYKAIAARLVAWMRWQGERRSGQVYVLAMTCDVPWPPRPEEDEDWREFGPGFYHPLDALSPHHERVEALASECPNPTCTPSQFVRGRLHVDIDATRDNDGYPVPAPCEHDGTNWPTVLVYLDWLMSQGWSWNEVHAWRETMSFDGIDP